MRSDASLPGKPQEKQRGRAPSLLGSLAKGWKARAGSARALLRRWRGLTYLLLLPLASFLLAFLTPRPEHDLIRTLQVAMAVGAGVLVARHLLPPALRTISGQVTWQRPAAAADGQSGRKTSSGGEAPLSDVLSEGALRRLVCLLFVYAGVQFATGAFGDRLLAWASARPQAVSTAAAGLGLTWLIARLGRALSGGVAQMEMEDVSSGSPPDAPRVQTTELQLRHAAAHEAGHLLLYAGISPLPEEIAVNLRKWRGADEPWGVVSGGYPEGGRAEKPVFFEWLMLMLLAGAAGERAMHGEIVMGSFSDNEKWMEAARPYLANRSSGGVFYVEPKSELEHRHNTRQMESLKSEQLSMLGVLFEKNAGVHREMAGALLEAETLNRAEIASLLERAQLPGGVPAL